jgi:iron complex transport system ATP-binding protein
MQDGAALTARALEVTLGRSKILRGIDFEARAGEMIAVVGPNGSGKTTLLRALCGILRPSAGEVSLAGRPLGEWPRRELARTLAYLPQETWTEFSLSVGEVVALGRFAHVGPFRPLRPLDREAVDRALRDAQISDLAHRPLPQLSGGERRRALLARAMAQESTLLLLDEPTTALDVGHACHVMDLLAGLRDAGRTVVVSLHDLTLALRGPDRVVLLDGGEVTGDGPPADVLTGASAARAFGVSLVRVGELDAVVPARTPRHSQGGASS